MQFRIQVTSGSEVNFAGIKKSSATYYGETISEDGEWKLDLRKVEKYLDECLNSISFGSSIETFTLGFEIADIDGWGNYFTALANYVSYRPKSKSIVSVAQFNWLHVKNLSAKEQYGLLIEAIEFAITRVGNQKRKPKDFNYPALLSIVNEAMKLVQPDYFLPNSQVT